MGLVRSPLSLFYAVNWEGREALWAVEAVAFLRHPFVGSGMGASTEALSRSFAIGQPHNEYIRLAVDVGVIGILFYAVAIIGWIRAVLRAWRRTRAAEDFAMPALGAFAAWAIVAITDNPFDYYGPLTQYVAFLAAAAVVAGRTADAPVRLPAATTGACEHPAPAGAEPLVQG